MQCLAGSWEAEDGQKQTEREGAAVTAGLGSPFLAHQHDAGLVIYREDGQVTCGFLQEGPSEALWK